MYELHLVEHNKEISSFAITDTAELLQRNSGDTVVSLMVCAPFRTELKMTFVLNLNSIEVSVCFECNLSVRN